MYSITFSDQGLEGRHNRQLWRVMGWFVAVVEALAVEPVPGVFVGALLVLIEGSNDYMRECLKAVRLEKGLRVEEVADQVDIKGSYYTMIEVGSRNPSVKVAKWLGALLGVEWSRFF